MSLANCNVKRGLGKQLWKFEVGIISFESFIG
jgi:hypothetical protein